MSNCFYAVQPCSMQQPKLFSSGVVYPSSDWWPRRPVTHQRILMAWGANGEYFPKASLTPWSDTWKNPFPSTTPWLSNRLPNRSDRKAQLKSPIGENLGNRTDLFSIGSVWRAKMNALRDIGPSKYRMDADGS